MRLRDPIDLLTGTDPGLLRLRNAVKAVLTIGLTLAAEYGFVHLTHALQVAGPPGPAVAAQHHAVQVIAMLLGAMIGMISSFAVADPTVRGRLVTMLFLPVPMVATLAAGLALGGHRLVSLVGFVVLLTVGTYCRRFGPRGFVGGVLLFFGAFLGFFLHAEIRLSQLGWLVAEIGVGLAVAIVVGLGLFPPRPSRDLRRLERSFEARARRLVALADELLSVPAHEPDDRRRPHSRALHRQLVRVNESALMIDAQLGDASSAPTGTAAAEVHQRLFDLELALANVVRFAEALAYRHLPGERRVAVRTLLSALAAGDLDAAELAARHLLDAVREAGHPGSGPDADVELVLLNRLGRTTLDLLEARAARRGLLPSEERAADAAAFEPAVQLFAGWLPGSTGVSAQASASGSRGRRAIPPYVRTAIQMCVAATAAITLGDLLSGRRFYWAVIAAFVSFMAANNTGEQARKAALRVVGTVAGIFVGGLLAHAVGDNTDLALVVILAALFFAFYLLRINYAFMVLGITIMVSQLYVQLGEYSDTLLVTRLEETAIGAGCAIVTVLVVLPLRPRDVLSTAAEAHFTAVGAVVESATGVMTGTATTDTLRASLRGVDASWQALLSTAQPLRRSVFGDRSHRLVATLAVAGSSRHYCRNLSPDLAHWRGLPDGCGPSFDRAAGVLATSVAAVAQRAAGSRDETYTRSAGLLDGVARELEAAAMPGQLAVRDLQLLDAALATLATELGMTVDDFDTTRVPAAQG